MEKGTPNKTDQDECLPSASEIQILLYTPTHICTYIRILQRENLESWQGNRCSRPLRLLWSEGIGFSGWSRVKVRHRDIKARAVSSRGSKTKKRMEQDTRREREVGIASRGGSIDVSRWLLNIATESRSGARRGRTSCPSSSSSSSSSLALGRSPGRRETVGRPRESVPKYRPAS